MSTNNFKVTGRITHLAPARQVSASFTVRDFVIEVPDGEYPQLARMQLVKDKCALLDPYKVGDEITVDFNIRGKLSDQGKVFTNLQAWRIQSAGGSQPAQSSGPTPVGADFEDDVPFSAVPWGAAL